MKRPLSGYGLFVLCVAVMALVLAACGGPDRIRSTTELVRIEISPSHPVLAKGTAMALKATAVYSDARTEDVTTAAAWTSSDPSRLALSGATALALNAGEVEVTASFGGESGRQSVTVSDAELVRLQVTPSPPVARGTSRQFNAIGIFSDQTTQDLTKQVRWSTSAPGVLRISNEPGSEGLAVFDRAGSARVIAAFYVAGSPLAEGSTLVTVTDATLEKIQLLQSDFRVAQTVAKGTKTAYTAVGIYSDHTTQTLTNLAVWSTSDSSKAEVSNAAGAKGIVTGREAGSVTLSVAYDGKSAEVPLTVTDVTLTSLQASISSPTPAGRVLGINTTEQLNAVAIFSDTTFQDVTNYAVWSSSDPGVADISNAAGSVGLVKALSAGTTTITASYRNVAGQSASYSFPLRVTDAAIVKIEVAEVNLASPYAPPAPVTVTWTTVSFRAMATYADHVVQDISTVAYWESSEPSVAPISNAAGTRGQARAISEGATSISAVFRGVSGENRLTVRDISKLVELQVSPVSPQLPAHMFQACRATGLVDTGGKIELVELSSNAVWQSSDEGVMWVSSGPRRGNLLTRAPGGATIVATLNMTDKSGSQPLTVTSATLRSIAVLQSGATPGDEAAMLDGSNLGFVATGSYSDNTSQTITTSVAWDSNDFASLQALNNGVLKGATLALSGSGTPTITASLTNGTAQNAVTGSRPVALKGLGDLVSLQVTPVAPSIPANTFQGFTATAVFSDNLKQALTTTVTWTSSNESVATVSNVRGAKGLAHAFRPESLPTPWTTTVRAILFLDPSWQDSTLLTVKNVTLTSLAVTPYKPLLPVGWSQAFTATGNYSDSSAYDITPLVVWSSNDPSVVGISNGLGTSGAAKMLDTGTADVTAAYYGPPGQ